MSIGGEYLQLIREMALSDLDNGDYVTLDRIDHGFMISERLLTFRDIIIQRRRAKYACDAKTSTVEENFFKDYEENS